MDNGGFSLHEVRGLAVDFMKPTPGIYWTDFLLSISLGWMAFYTALNTPLNNGMFYIAYGFAALALYRAVIFIHELAHLRKGSFRLFRRVWNLLCGIPLLVPSFSYDGVHNDHHKPDIYGTNKDGEYIPFAVKQPGGMIAYVFLSLILPVFFILRSLVLTPLSYLSPAIRKFTWKRASSLTIDLSYERPAWAITSDTNWRWQEFAAFIFAATAAALLFLGILPMKAFYLWYAIGVMIFFLNSLRTLAAHAYRNPGTEQMSVSEQYLDSVNVPGERFFTTLWAPVGLRYHATHHLFPAMPYHNLGRAHRHIAKNLTDNQAYLSTTRTGLLDALRRMWREAAAAKQS